MDITPKALRRIQRIRSQKGMPKETGVRLGMRAGNVCLKWDCAGPRQEDLVVVKRGLPIFIDVHTYSRLADYQLDFERGGGHPGFLLRPRPTIESSDGEVRL